MLKKIVGFFAALVMAMIGVNLIASPAQAYANCPSTSICFFTGYDGGGTRTFEADNGDRPGCFKLSSPNTTKSIDNDRSGTDWNARVYTGSSGCTGLSTLVYGGTQGNMSGTWYNSLDYVYIY